MEPTFVAGAGGLQIAVHDLGGSGPDLLVAHATGFHAACYRALAAELADRFHVVAFDCRGHGRSATPSLAQDAAGDTPEMAWPLMAEDLLAVVEAVGLDRPVGFGHSCGGALSLLAEAARPGTFRALALYEPVVFPAAPAAARPADGPPNPLAAGARRRRPVFASRAAALENYAGKAPLSWWRPDVLADYVDGGFADEPDGTVRLRCAPEAEAATFDMARGNGAWERLDQVACPTVVMCGGPKADFGIEVARSVAERLPAGRAEAHEDLSHFGPFERPEEVAAAITAIASA